jgi:hypothetical protein
MFALASAVKTGIDIGKGIGGTIYDTEQEMQKSRTRGIPRAVQAVETFGSNYLKHLREPNSNTSNAGTTQLK